MNHSSNRTWRSRDPWWPRCPMILGKCLKLDGSSINSSKRYFDWQHGPKSQSRGLSSRRSAALSTVGHLPNFWTWKLPTNMTSCLSRIHFDLVDPHPVHSCIHALTRDWHGQRNRNISSTIANEKKNSNYILKVITGIFKHCGKNSVNLWSQADK